LNYDKEENINIFILFYFIYNRKY